MPVFSLSRAKTARRNKCMATPVDEPRFRAKAEQSRNVEGVVRPARCWFREGAQQRRPESEDNNNRTFCGSHDRSRSGGICPEQNNPPSPSNLKQARRPLRYDARDASQGHADGPTWCVRLRALSQRLYARKLQTGWRWRRRRRGWWWWRKWHVTRRQRAASDQRPRSGDR